MQAWRQLASTCRYLTARYHTYTLSPAYSEVEEEELIALGCNIIYLPRLDGESKHLMGMPREILDMNLAEGLISLPNGTTPDAKYTFEDRVRHDGRPRRMGPEMTPVGLVNPQLRYAVRYNLYNCAVMGLTCYH